MIEIDLGSLQKAKTKQRVWVKPTANKVGYHRMQEVGRKEEEKKVKYESVPGLYGRLPKYDSMPKSIKIPEKEVEKMNLMANKSRELGVEIISGINRRSGNMTLSKGVVGESESCKFSDVKSNFGSYHTHPPITDEIKKRNAVVINSLSFGDIFVLISRRMKNLKIMMAHDVEHNNLWVAVVSGDGQRMLNTLTQKDIRESFELKESLSIKGKTHKELSENYRFGLKDFCDSLKIKLYYGPPNGELKEYEGDW